MGDQIKSQLEKDSKLWKVKKGTPLEEYTLSFLHRLWANESTYFPGPQPISIERKHFPILKKSEYLVCEKTDGVRHVLCAFMFCDKKVCFLVNRALDILLVTVTLPKHAYQGTILDGEFVNQELFMVYDSVFVSGVDVKNENLLKRLESADSVVSGILKMKTDPITIKIKTFYNYKNISEFKKIYKSLTCKTDGVIFTPVNEPIRVGTHETMFKWKPRDLNTIDFQAKLWYDGTKWGLYVQEKGRLVFESELTHEETPEWIKEDSIVECQYMCDEEPRWWKPICLRTDKVHPNNRRTFYRTLTNIRENIKLSEFK
jgi:hypothetical protein